ncbi:hypothetical protein EV647_3369 [Kribbella sp. VKM Ac-2566]|nr:hypothetical protein EV647_3369 [Kribbella sp. VKM Ac-2566]
MINTYRAQVVHLARAAHAATTESADHAHHD